MTSFRFKFKLMSHSDFKMKWNNERNIESHFSLKLSFRPYLCYLEQFVKECSPSSCSQISWWYTMNDCSNIKEFWFYLQTKETRIFRHFVLFLLFLSGWEFLFSLHSWPKVYHIHYEICKIVLYITRIKMHYQFDTEISVKLIKHL